MKIFQELSEFTKKVTQVTTLEHKRNEAKNLFGADAAALSEIDAKIEKGKSLQERADTLLAQQEFTKEDIFEKAQGILAELKSAKIEICQKESLLSLEKSYKWMEKFYNFWAKKQPTTPSQETMEIETVKTPAVKGKEAFNLATACRVCLNTSVFENEFSKYSQELTQIIKAGQAIEHLDVRIQEVFYKYAHLLWNKEAQQVLSRRPISLKDLNALQESAELYSIDENDPTLLELQQAESDYKRVMESYQQLKATEEFNHIIDQENIEEIAAKVKELKAQLQDLKIANEEALQTINNASLVIDWLEKARKIKKLHEEGKRINFQDLRDAASLGSLIKIPQNRELFKIVKSRHDELSTVMDKYNKYKKIQADYNETLRQINQNQDQKSRKKQLIESYKKRPMLSECKKVLDAIRNSKLEIDDQEIERLESAIKATEAWHKDLENFFAKHQLDKQKYNLQQSTADEISAELNSLRTQMMTVPLQIDKIEKKLFEYEWTFHAVMKFSPLINRSEKNSIKDWTQLKKKADDSASAHPEILESKIYKELNEQINLYNKLTSQVNEFKNAEEKLQNLTRPSKDTSHSKSDKDPLINYRKELKNAVDLKRLDDDFAKCKIDTTEEKKYVEDLLNRVKRALELNYEYCTENLEKGTKSPLQSISNLLDTFRKLPIVFLNEERNLDQLIQKAKSLQKSLEDSKLQLRDSKIEFTFAKSIVEQYKGIPILIKEAETLQKDFNHCKEILENVSSKIEQQKNDLNLDYNEIRQLAEQVDHLPMDLGDELEEIKCNVWNLEVSSVKKNEDSYSKDLNESSRITLSALKALLLEGYSLLTSKNAIEKLRENIIYLEQLATKAEGELKDLYNIQSMELLEAFHSSHQSFVDIKEEIIEQKVKLSMDQGHQSKVESFVRNIFQNSDDQILNNLTAEKSQNNESYPNDGQKTKKDKKAAGPEPSEKKNIKATDKTKRRIQHNKMFDEEFRLGDEMSGMSPDASDKSDVEWESRKKVKLDSAGQSADKVIPGQKGGSDKKGKKVSEELRQENQKKFATFIKQNPHFSDVTEEQAKKYSKDIEMNIFSELHDDAAKYMSQSDDLRALLQKLKQYKYLSKTIVNKHFAIDILSPLVKQKDSRYEFYEQRAEQKHKGTIKHEKEPKGQAKKGNAAKGTRNEDDLKMLLEGQSQTQAPSRFQALVTKKEVEKKNESAPGEGGETMVPEESKPKPKKRSRFTDEPAYFSDEDPEGQKLSQQKLSKEVSMEEMHQEGSAPPSTTNKHKKEAILFDPDDEADGENSKSLATGSGVKGAYDPTMVEHPLAKESSGKMIEVEEVEYPPGSILKVLVIIMIKKTIIGNSIDF
mgnify:FL=1